MIGRVEKQHIYFPGFRKIGIMEAIKLAGESMDNTRQMEMVSSERSAPQNHTYQD